MKPRCGRCSAEPAVASSLRCTLLLCPLGPLFSSSSFRPWAVPAAWGPKETQGEALVVKPEAAGPSAGRRVSELSAPLAEAAALLSCCGPGSGMAVGDARVLTWLHAGKGETRAAWGQPGFTISEAWSCLGSDLARAVGRVGGTQLPSPDGSWHGWGLGLGSPASWALPTHGRSYNLQPRQGLGPTRSTV